MVFTSKTVLAKKNVSVQLIVCCLYDDNGMMEIMIVNIIYFTHINVHHHYEGSFSLHNFFAHDCNHYRYVIGQK